MTFHYEVEKIKWAKPEEPEIVQLLPLVLVSEEKDRPRCDKSLPPTERVESPPLMTKFQHLLPKIPGVGDLPDKPQAQGNLLSVSERTSDEMERLSPPSSFMPIITSVTSEGDMANSSLPPLSEWPRSITLSPPTNTSSRSNTGNCIFQAPLNSTF
jgi:hypothetical protein